MTLFSPQLALDVHSDQPGNEQWLFLPGGPGLSGAYLKPLAQCMNLPGKSFLADYPGCGTHPVEYQGLDQWRLALLNTFQQLGSVGIVAHSFSGMFILNYPEFSPFISKLIIVNSAPFFDLQKQASVIKQKGMSSLTRIVAPFINKPSNQSFADYLLALTPYFAQSRQSIQQILSHGACQVRPFIDAFESFFKDFRFQWVPECATLTIGGDNDVYVPARWFIECDAFQVSHIQHEIISNTGHFCWLEAPKIVGALVADFATATDSLES